MTVKREFEGPVGDTCELQCRKCCTVFTDEGLLRGHEEVCVGAINEHDMGTFDTKGESGSVTSRLLILLL